MTKTDLSTEALLDRKAIAERATPGSWEHIIKRGVGTDNGHTVPLRIAVTNFEEDATHIAANSPDVVIATIDELLRLREALAEAADYIGDESCGSAEFWRKYRVALEAARRAVEEV